MQTSLKLKTARVAKAATRKQRDLNKIPDKAHKRFVKLTPVRTGNARRRTKLQGETIKANYPYAHPLDNGHSKQAREGMSKPTVRYIRDLVEGILGR